MISPKTSGVLRGVAILIVIASHYAGWMYAAPAHPLAQAWISTWGPPGVDIFFLLSGYGLYKSAMREETGGGAAESGRSSCGITAHFVVGRLFSAVVPYLIVAGFIGFYAHTWSQAAAEGRLFRALLDYFTAADYWYMQVLFVFYAAFIVCFRFGYALRVPLLAAAVIGYTVWLFRTGHADFFTLSNAAFLLGVLAAGAERLFPEILKKSAVRMALSAAGAAGMLITFWGMERNGGSGVPESFGWELLMNLFFSLIALSVAWGLSIRRDGLLGLLGRTSLFIYLLHTVLFWALIFRFEALFSSYARGAAAAGIVTLAIAVPAGLVYSHLIGCFLKKRQ